MNQPDTPIQVTAVVTLAEALETSAAEVYRQAAAETGRTKVREALLGLAEMEDGHLLALRELRAQVSADSPVPGQVDERAVDFFEAWVDGRLFAPREEPPAAARPADSVEAWLETAIGMEKESIAFYSGLREMVAPTRRATVDHLIGEEVHHLVTLSALLRSLTGAPGRRRRPRN